MVKKDKLKFEGTASDAATAVGRRAVTKANAIKF
jgi:hypothetical protein